MHDDRHLVEQRLDRVLDERIRPAVYSACVPLSAQVWHVPGEPVPPATALAAQFGPASIGQRWGRPWGTSWFRFSGEVPAGWAGRTVEAVVDLGFNDDKPGFAAEGMAYLADGTPLKGLHPRNRWVPVRSPALGGEQATFYVEAAANPEIVGPVTLLGDPETAGDEPLYRLDDAVLAVFDEPVWELVRDLEVLGQLMRELPAADPRRWQILRAIDGALDAIDLRDIGGTATAARDRLGPALAVPARASAHRISAVGHAHIDSAWLWPLRETTRKVARTCATVTHLMDHHRELVFAMSQAQQLAWLAEHRPEVYGQVKEKISDGRFLPVGGMWVEADTNLPGGEALARQLVHGKRFFLNEFGIETREVWLPDSFGFSAALPQLVKLSGSRWFLTQKISWNQTNRFPHHTFWWEGLDGSRVFTHFPPSETYGAEVTGAELAHAVGNFAEKGASDRSLLLFGYGDGGGGPTREMLGRASRLRDLDGSPRLEIAPPANFFTAAEGEYGETAPVWAGELYLEYHRGTYTSQSRTKQGNRRCEHLLREAELWAATATVRIGRAYPYEQLDRIWKTVLLHQFHDILPGSSIAWVHRDAVATYAAVTDELNGIIDAAQSALAGPGDDPVVFNAAPHHRGGIPAGGAVVDPGNGAAPVSASIDEGGWLLDNSLLRVAVDHRGLITSVVDVAADREVVPPGMAANLLQLHPDLPNDWDAWDIDSHYRNTVTDLVEADEVSLSAKSAGAATVVAERTQDGSRFTQRISLTAGAKLVHLETEVDWQHTETLLKASFPMDVRADTSAAETQFGHVRRPCHTNTAWDAAKFEICAHRFVHLAEPAGHGWGAAVVNDSVYGHDVTRTVRADGGTTTTVRLSLLRAPRYPDPETDHGTHRFGYALAPGADLLDAAREGYRINLPPRTLRGSRPVEPLVTVDNDAAVVEAVKLADDESGDIVVRLYEATGACASARLSSGLPVAAAAETDLLERAQTGLAVHDDAIELDLRPFQIRTIRLTPRLPSHGAPE